MFSPAPCRAAAALATLVGGCAAAAVPASLIPGDHVFSLSSGGRTRSYKLHVPPGHDVLEPTALVLMLHGGGGSADQASRQYGWSEKSDAAGLLVAYPQGVSNTWNAMHCCGRALRDGVDDVGFLGAVVDDIRARTALDPRRIFATGMSNGAMMVHRLGAARPDLFAAIAPVAGSIGGQVGADSPVVMPAAPAAPVAVINFHGTADLHVLYDGGETIAGLTRGRIDLSVDEAVNFWVQANGCNPVPQMQTNDSGNVVMRTHASPDGFADVVLYTLVGQGHAWPGGRKSLGVALGLTDPPSTEISATDAIWDFFRSHPRPAH